MTSHFTARRSRRHFLGAPLTQARRVAVAVLGWTAVGVLFALPAVLSGTNWPLPEGPDTQAGGHTNHGPVTDTRLKISYHGARTVTGGTPSAFNDRSDANPFGVFKEVENGGRIIVMGDGMVSLYMTSWEGVQDYQCQELMQAAFRRLLKSPDPARSREGL